MVTAAALLFAFVSCSPDAIVENCANELDDDADAFVDCADQDCSASCTELCHNDKDDDRDGLIDCFDPQCDSGCVEICGNGMDDDDDGHVDCADTACSEVCTELCDNDVDDDGDWITDCWDSGCTSTCDVDSDGYFSVEFGHDDCDDQDPNVHPGQPEIYYDDIDNDCDTNTVDGDQDADSFDVSEDCDDNDSTTYPGAPEQCGDQTLNDCQGGPPGRPTCYGDREFGSADGLLLGIENDDKVGTSVAFAGDLNGDGHQDLLVGAIAVGIASDGAAYIVLGPIVGAIDLTNAHTTVLGEGDDWLGSAVAGGFDLTGDARDDAVIGAQYHDAGASNTGGVFVFTAEAQGEQNLEASTATLAPVSEYTQAGFALSVSADLTGDGLPDLAIGGPTESNFAGAVYIAQGPVFGFFDLSAPSVPTLRGETPGDNAGHSVSTGSDINGDGLDDLVIGAHNDSSGGQDAGAAYVNLGPILVSLSLVDADALYVGKSSHTAGSAVSALGDADGDGYGDWAVGAPGADSCALDGGLVSIHFGPSLGLVGDAETELCSAMESANAGTSISPAGRFDDGGLADLAIGAPGADLDGAVGGIAYLLAGPISGKIDLDVAADVRIFGTEFAGVGTTVAGGRDVNADGYADLLVGATTADGMAEGSGAVSLFTFGF